MVLSNNRIRPRAHNERPNRISQPKCDPTPSPSSKRSIDQTLRGVSSQESRLGEKSVSSLVTRLRSGGYSMECIGIHVPCNLLVLALTRLNGQTHLVHFVHIACGLHIRQNVVLQIGYRLQWVRHVLILLNVADHLGRLCALGKVDQICLLDQRRDTVLDECKISKVNTCTSQPCSDATFSAHLPKKGIQGGFALWSVSRYSAKFLVLPISLRMLSKTAIDRAFTALHVRFKR